MLRNGLLKSNRRRFPALRKNDCLTVRTICSLPKKEEGFAEGSSFVLFIAPFDGLCLFFHWVFVAPHFAPGIPVSDPCCWKVPRNRVSSSSSIHSNWPPLAW